MNNLRFVRRLAFAAAIGMFAVRARAAAPGRLPFIENDYAKALHDARARHVPIFVEAWAPW